MEFNWDMAVGEITQWNNTLVEETIKESYDGDVSATNFHDAIWFASTKILKGLEVQVVIDANDALHVSSGTSGYVDFKIDPVGMKLPIKCWIHTHPFGSAYFSGTDIRTVSIWEPLMKTAYVLGGRGHYGSWENTKPKQLMIFRDYGFERVQRWGEGTYGYDENEKCGEGWSEEE
tara:strand:+ start:1916 stop:2440 length:525 start_codon:yes stop_codon:yes gene_type:complete